MIQQRFSQSQLAMARPILNAVLRFAALMLGFGLADAINQAVTTGVYDWHHLEVVAVGAFVLALEQVAKGYLSQSGAAVAPVSPVVAAPKG